MLKEQMSYGRIISSGVMAKGLAANPIFMELFKYFKVKIVSRVVRIFEPAKSSYDSYLTWIVGR